MVLRICNIIYLFPEPFRVFSGASLRCILQVTLRQSICSRIAWIANGRAGDGLEKPIKRALRTQIERQMVARWYFNTPACRDHLCSGLPTLSLPFGHHFLAINYGRATPARSFLTFLQLWLSRQDGRMGQQKETHTFRSCVCKQM